MPYFYVPFPTEVSIETDEGQISVMPTLQRQMQCSFQIYELLWNISGKCLERIIVISMPETV